MKRYLAAFVSLLVLLIACTPAPEEDSDRPEPRDPEESVPLEPVPPREMWDFSYEMHWGMLGALTPPTDDPDLRLSVDGKVTITDGDPDTQEGIHIISAQLFESDDRVDSPPRSEAFEENGGIFYPWIAWRSATTTDWDGMAFRLRFTKGTDPTVRIETSVWEREFKASELHKHSEVISIGDDGQSLEMGRFFDLTYKVYDLALSWGFLDESEASGPTDWDGSITFAGGGINVFATKSFEEEDSIIQEPELGPTLSIVSTNTPGSNRHAGGDGLALNLVAPRELSRPELRISVAGVDETFILPARPADREEIMENPGGGVVKAHLHWCWFKRPVTNPAPLGF